MPAPRIYGCGTPAGYKRHARYDQAPCDECRDAHNAARRQRRADPPAPKQLKPCGTDAAYRRHWARGEKPCFACRLAHSQALKARTEAKTQSCR